MYGGAISGRGPRYCPSIEDKIVRFPDAVRHQVFLEPEGLDTTEMYVNGLSTSLPPSVQLEYLRSVPGLERVEMTRPGYAIEYDYFPPTQLEPTLKVRGIDGLYFAGQINGTTGYEEAAGQGVVAGLNAAASALDGRPIPFRRDEAFLGVLVDDLVTRGVDEPYRLFTSRAEFRLMLRQDNALRRLLPAADRLGSALRGESDTAESALKAEERVMAFAVETPITPRWPIPSLESAGSAPITEPVRLAELARRPGVGASICSWRRRAIRPSDGGGGMGRDRAPLWRLHGAGAGYGRQDVGDGGVRYSRRLEFFGSLDSLSHEAREKLTRLRPSSLGQAGRIPGSPRATCRTSSWRFSRAGGRSAQGVSRETRAMASLIPGLIPTGPPSPHFLIS